MNYTARYERGILVEEKMTGGRTEWPLWAKMLKRFSKPEDRGIGDVVTRMIGEETSEAFKQWHKVTFGKDCGCNGRQAGLNARYPLGHEQ